MVCDNATSHAQEFADFRAWISSQQHLSASLVPVLLVYKGEKYGL
ncbi:hypothetical protein VCRA2126E14_20202 [Vibrio crassostreae]|nr:hypothetical protein VCRA2110O2_20165 [Vibrio crassostreae]CAK3503341.1 hypothetical protein VCRA2126E14_20202 [Vibrio crassostreae]